MKYQLIILEELMIRGKKIYFSDGIQAICAILKYNIFK